MNKRPPCSVEESLQQFLSLVRAWAQRQSLLAAVEQKMACVKDEDRGDAEDEYLDLIEVTRRVLLMGPSGSGKSHFVKRAEETCRALLPQCEVAFVSLADCCAHGDPDGSTGLSRYFRLSSAVHPFCRDSSPKAIPPTQAGLDWQCMGTPRLLVFDHAELAFPPHDSESGLSVTRSSASASAPSGIIGASANARAPRETFHQRSAEPRCSEIVLRLLHHLGSLSPSIFFVALCTTTGVGGPESALDIAVLRHGFEAIVDVPCPATAERLALLERAAENCAHGGNFWLPIARYLAHKTGGFPMGSVFHLASVLEGMPPSSSGPEWDALGETLGLEAFSSLVLARQVAVEANSAALHAAVRSAGGHLLRLAGLSHSQSASQFGFVDVCETSWDDIIGLQKQKQRLIETFVEPLQWRAEYLKRGLRPSIGVLLYGLPGTGKTMLARAMATELSASFVYLDLPQLVHAEVGESERTLEHFFNLARQRAPCVMFLDEIQSMFGRRGADRTSGSAHDSRLTSYLLMQLDECRVHCMDSPILFVGATNQPQMLDPALLRAGRIDTFLFIPTPSEGERAEIAAAILRRCWVRSAAVDAEDAERAVAGVSLLASALACRTQGCSGADIVNAVNMLALQTLSKADYNPTSLVEYLATGTVDGGASSWEAGLQKVLQYCGAAPSLLAARAIESWEPPL